jgi:hypothetical protein
MTGSWWKPRQWQRQFAVWWKRQQRSLVLWAVGIALLGWIIGSSESAKECVGEHQNQEGGKAPVERLTNFSVVRRFSPRCVSRFVESNDKVIIALGTLAIALFTFTLWRTTGRTLSHLEREFFAVHRPKLDLRQLSLVRGGSALIDNTGRIEGVLTNVGGSTAIVIDSRITHATVVGNAPLKRNLDYGEIELLNQATVIPAGGREYVTVSDTTVVMGFRHAHQASPTDTRRNVLFGYVRYVDAVGAPRQVGFRRFYNPDTGVFDVEAADPDYEYPG